MPLVNGDSLDSAEFLRRYQAMPRIKKAELIEGIVYMSSPVSAEHSEADGLIHTCLGYYAAHAQGVRFHPNTTVILDSGNTIQPDAILRLAPERGGRTRLDANGYILGAPEFVVEVAVSSASIDLRGKRQACERNRVLEYIVWIIGERQLKWFTLEGDDYRQQQPDAEALFHSRAFPGLALSLPLLLSLDLAGVLAVVQRELAKPPPATTT